MIYEVRATGKAFGRRFASSNAFFSKANALAYEEKLGGEDWIDWTALIPHPYAKKRIVGVNDRFVYPED